MINLIKTRRSIRKFKQDDISNEHINIMLEAAMYAPSANNKQPWQFIVIKNKETFSKLTEYLPNAKMLPMANTCIVVCGDKSAETIEGYNAINCAAATQNILLAIHALKLGGVWLGVYPREERIKAINKLLNMPDNIFPFSMIAIGVPDEKPAQPERFDSSKIHYESF